MNNSNTLDDVSRLRSLIGRQVHHQGQLCQIIEILEDGPALILQEIAQHPTIQPDQHGEAHRRVPATITVPVLDKDGTHYSRDFAALNLNGLF